MAERNNQQSLVVIVPEQDSPIEEIVRMVIEGLDSPHSQRAYGRAIRKFMEWHRDGGRKELSKAMVQRYVSELRKAGISPSSINQRMLAIRRFAREAADNGLLDPQLANGIVAIKGVKYQGRRTGNWLTREQAQSLLESPVTRRLKGVRDRALLALLVGCGVRRTEAANLTFEHIQQRDGGWVLVDLVGKGNKVRSVPMPAWAKALIDVWSKEAGIDSGKVFRSMNRHGKIVRDRMSPQAVRNVVVEYAGDRGLEGIAPHDLRRTFAKLAHKGGAGLEQIQLSLGHASIQTTERYLGVEQDLIDAPCDHLGLRIRS
jgi:integrase